MKPRKPFTSDGCSVFFEGVWGGCCVDHDFAYWAGGSAADRYDADCELRACVRRQGHPFIAQLMFIGVRIFGGPRSPFWFRWGYGYNYLESITYDKQVALKGR